MNKVRYKQKISHTNQKVCKLSCNISNKLIDANPIGTTCRTTSPPRSCWMKGALVHLLSQSFFEMTHSFHVFLSNIPSIEWPNVKAEERKREFQPTHWLFFNVNLLELMDYLGLEDTFLESLLSIAKDRWVSSFWSQRTSSHAQLLVPMIWALKKEEKTIGMKVSNCFYEIGRVSFTRTEIPAQ